MANELTVLQAISTAGQAITSMTQSLKVLKSFRKQDAVVLKEQLEFIKYACRARGYSELVRLSVEEMNKTIQAIEQKNFSPDMKAMSMELLSMQLQALKQNIQRYISG